MALKKSFIVLILCLALLSAALAACSNGGEESAVPSGTQSDLSGTAADAFPYEGNFEGQTVRILTVSSDRHLYGEQQFVADEELSGNVINDAVAERNNLIEQLYGLTIEVDSAQYPSEEMQNYFLSGDARYDLVCESVDRMVTQVSENHYWSLDDLLNLEDPWWDQRSVDILSLDGTKHFFVSGDGMLTNVDHIYLTLFNKDLYDTNADVKAEFGDLYEMVENGTFTLDNFYAISRAVSVADENGDWGMDATFGNLSHAYGATIMVNGAGMGMVEKDGQGGLTVTVGTQRGIDIFQKVYDLMSNKNVTQRAELIAGQGPNPSTYGFAELEYMFVNGHGLFYNTTVSSISILKNSSAERNFEFGVLPIPKYDEAQDEYYCAVNRYQSSVLGIPTTNTDNLEATTFLMNALGYYNTHMPSGKTVMDAYYETTLKLQATDTDEDARMLDIIFDSAFYDLGSIFTWGTLSGLYGSVISNDADNTLVSSWQQIESAVTAAMEETVRQYRESIT